MLLSIASAKPAANAGAAASGVVHYELAPEMVDGSIRSMAVSVSFLADPSGTTGFGWAKEWAGENRLWQWERDLRVTGAQAVVADRPGHWKIMARPSSPLTVRYRIVTAYDQDPTASDINQAWPIVRPRWFESIGYALFGVPDDAEKSPATFDWLGTAAGLRFDSDLLHLPDRNGRRPGRGTVEDIENSVAIAGFDLKAARDASTGARIAYLGEYHFSTPDLMSLIAKLIKAERAFWNDPTEAPFLVTGIPVKVLPKQTVYAGTGLDDAFAMRLGTTTKFDYLPMLMAHEFFHTWNASQLAGYPHDVSKETLSAWMGEGFTDYYALVFALRSGAITRQQWSNAWNAKLLDYARSPFRATPNTEAAAQYWASYAGARIPYDRGAILAALWNHRLLQRSSGRTSLDDVMRAQRIAARSSRDTLVPLFIQTMKRFGVDVSSDVQRYVDEGDPVLLPADAFGPCAEVATSEEPRFDAGFNVDATKKAGGVATGVDPGSNAYAAGLRDGMKIAMPAASSRIGNPLKAWTIEVDDVGAARTLSYMPQGKAMVPVQRIVLKSPAPPACQGADAFGNAAVGS